MTGTCMPAVKVDNDELRDVLQLRQPRWHATWAGVRSADRSGRGCGPGDSRAVMTTFARVGQSDSRSAV